MSNKWKIEDPVIYSNSSGETVASAFQKQIVIDNKHMERINRLRNNDSEQLNDEDTIAYQFKVDKNNNLLKIRNANNDGWVTIGAINKDYLGFIPDTIGAVKNNDGTVPGIGAKEIANKPDNSQGIDGDILLDKKNKRIYQKLKGKWELYASNKTSDMSDYEDLVLKNQLSTTSSANKILVMNNQGKLDVDITGNAETLGGHSASYYLPASEVTSKKEPNKVPRLNNEGKLEVDITGTANSIGGVKIDTTTKAEGGALVYRSTANDGQGGYVHEQVGPSSLIDDTNSSISKTYSSDKIRDVIAKDSVASLDGKKGDLDLYKLISSKIPNETPMMGKSMGEYFKNYGIVKNYYNAEACAKNKLPFTEGACKYSFPWFKEDHSYVELLYGVTGCAWRYWRNDGTKHENAPWYKFITDSAEEQTIKGALSVGGVLKPQAEIQSKKDIHCRLLYADTSLINLDTANDTVATTGFLSKIAFRSLPPFAMDDLSPAQLAAKGMYKTSYGEKVKDYVTGIGQYSTILGFKDTHNGNNGDSWQIGLDHHGGGAPNNLLKYRHVTAGYTKVKDVPWNTVATEASVDKKIDAIKVKSQMEPTGYRVHPDGMIEQWGSTRINNDETTITYPIAFKTRLLDFKAYQILVINEKYADVEKVIFFPSLFGVKESRMIRNKKYSDGKIDYNILTHMIFGRKDYRGYLKEDYKNEVRPNKPVADLELFWYAKGF